MSLLQLFAGTGRRRKSEGNWNDLERKASDAEARAARVKGAVLNTCPARVHGPFWVHTNKPVACPWCLVDQLRGQLELVTMRPAPRPDAVAVAAPADQAVAAIGRPEDEPAADVTAETQPVDVRELRAAVGEDDTVTLPAVTASIPAVTTIAPQPPVHVNDDTQMLVTWGTKLPDAGPTEVPVGAGARASIKVATALDEAS